METEDDVILTKFLYNFGPMTNTGMGPVPVPWREMLAWQQCTHTILAPWQMEALGLMTRAFVAEYNAASGEDMTSPPYSSEEFEEEKAVEAAAALKAGLRGLKRQGGPSKARKAAARANK